MSTENISDSFVKMLQGWVEDWLMIQRAYPSSLVDLNSSLLVIFWVDLDPNVRVIRVKSKLVELF